MRHVHTLLLVVWLRVAPVNQFIHAKRTRKICIGIVLMIGGAVMATNPIGMVPHFIWDAVAYGIHGYGALPVLKFIGKKFNLEDIDEPVTKA